MWKRKKDADSKNAYVKKRSQQFQNSVLAVLQDINGWSELQPPIVSLAAQAFTNRCQLDFGYVETAAEVFDSLPVERRDVVESAARNFFRLTDPTLLKVQQTREIGPVTLDWCFTRSFAAVIEMLVGDGDRDMEDDELFDIVGKRLAAEALAVKKTSSEQFAQRGIDNVVSVELVARWLKFVSDLRAQSFMQNSQGVGRVIPFDSVNMQLPLPRTVQDLLGTTSIEEGVVTLDMRGVIRTPFERITDAFLAFQMGDFTTACILYLHCQDTGGLSPRRAEDLRISLAVTDGDRSEIQNAPLGMTSDQRLEYLRADSPRPYADVIPVGLDPEFEETVDRAFIAEGAGRMEEYFSLIEHISEQQVLPPDFALTFAYKCLESGRNIRCIEECRALLDVPNYYSEDIRLRALEYLATASRRELRAKDTVYATLEALHINISSCPALNSLSELSETISKDNEMSLLLKLRVIAILRAEGDIDNAALHRGRLEKRFGGNFARFD